ncbi:MAG: trehalose-phosphatase [Desulfurococcaceae archaeon]
MLRVGLFFDYDGVLAPITRDPLGNSVSPNMRRAIEALSKHYAISIVSGRDCPYLHERVPGLLGYACVFGLEIHGGGYIVLDREVYFGSKSTHISNIYANLGNILKGKFGAIYGRTLGGTPLGLSVYWLLEEGRPKGVDVLLEEAKRAGLYVSNISKWGNFAEYVDIHLTRRTKQESVRILKTLINIDRVIYFGDAESDFPAFNEADVSVFIKHQYNTVPNEINVDYVVDYNDLPLWILRNINKISSSMK